jgi:hypothetical protein
LLRRQGGVVIRIGAPFEARVQHILRDYSYWMEEGPLLVQQLETLSRVPRGTTAAWKALVAGGKWDAFVRAVLLQHYDNNNEASRFKHFPASQKEIFLSSLEPDAISRAADDIAAEFDPL